MSTDKVEIVLVKNIQENNYTHRYCPFDWVVCRGHNCLQPPMVVEQQNYQIATKLRLGSIVHLSYE